MTRKTATPTLASAMRILARQIQSQDGVANAAIAEAAERLDEEGDEPFCNCGGHSIEEMDWNQCDCCGKPIYDEEPAVSPAPTFQDGMTEADDRRFLEATGGLDRYELPRCFRCGHLLHAGDCVNVAPHNALAQPRAEAEGWSESAAAQG